MQILKNLSPKEIKKIAEYLEIPKEDLSLNNKIIYYGTSITQGGCASRPGMAYYNILSGILRMIFGIKKQAI